MGNCQSFWSQAVKKKKKTTIPWFHARCIFHPHYALHPFMLWHQLFSLQKRTVASCWRQRRGARICGVMLLLLIVAGLGVVTLLVILFAPHIRWVASQYAHSLSYICSVWQITGRLLLAWQDITLHWCGYERSGSFKKTPSSYLTQLSVILEVLLPSLFISLDGGWFSEEKKKINETEWWSCGSFSTEMNRESSISCSGLSGGWAWEELYLNALLQRSYWLMWRLCSVAWVAPLRTVHYPSFSMNN